jgi:hypothetical protein
MLLLVVSAAMFQAPKHFLQSPMSDFAQLLQGLIVLLIVSGAFALLLQRVFLFFKGSAKSGCSSGCSSCPSRCSQPLESTDEDSVQVFPLSDLRKL